MINIEETTRRVLGDILGWKPEEIGLDADLCDDLHADSLDKVEITIALEQEFEIEISDEATDGWKTPADVIKTVTTLREARG